MATLPTLPRALAVIAASIMGPVSPVRLDSLLVPPVVRNGTLEHVVLDCPYSLGPGERDGIVLKWYLNSNTVPIYQWIPPSHPQGLGSMRHKLDLDYEISADPYKRHRALYISQPSTEMSGVYTCKVSTLENEVSASSRMVIYTPPRRLVVVTRRSGLNTVNVSCMVDHTFPRPHLTLLMGHQNRVRLQAVKENVNRYPNGAWLVAISTVLEDASLQLENLFECVMVLPGTDFRLSRSTIYSPRQPAVLARSNTFSGSSTNLIGGSSLMMVRMIIFIISVKFSV